MKRIALMLYLLGLHVILGFLLLKTDALDRVSVRFGFKDAPPAPIIATMREVHRQMDASVPDGATIFLGDSITMALATAAVAPNAVNYGIGYQRSDELIESMRRYESMQRAARVVVAIGTNDVLQGRADGIESRYAAILAAIPPHVPVVMSSPPPLAEHSTEGVGDAAKRACAVRSGCTFVDSSTVGTSGLLPDGVHLAPQGYRRWIAALRDGVRTQEQS